MKRIFFLVYLLIFLMFAAKSQTPVNINTNSAGWKRVAEIGGATGRGIHEVTIYTMGGSYTPTMSTIKWFKSWDNTGGMLITNESNSDYWPEARITFDGTKAHLELYFSQAIVNSMQAFVHENSWGYIAINAGTLPDGGGTVVCQTKIGKLNVDNKLFVNYNGNVGVGTTTPSARLELYRGTNETLKIDRQSGYASVKATSSNYGWLILDSYGSGTGGVSLNHYVTDNVCLAIGGGNVGIGTNNPTARVHTIEMVPMPVELLQLYLKMEVQDVEQ